MKKHNGLLFFIGMLAGFALFFAGQHYNNDFAGLDWSLSSKHGKSNQLPYFDYKEITVFADNGEVIYHNTGDLQISKSSDNILKVVSNRPDKSVVTDEISLVKGMFFVAKTVNDKHAEWRDPNGYDKHDNVIKYAKK